MQRYFIVAQGAPGVASSVEHSQWFVVRGLSGFHGSDVSSFWAYSQPHPGTVEYSVAKSTIAGAHGSSAVYKIAMGGDPNGDDYIPEENLSQSKGQWENGFDFSFWAFDNAQRSTMATPHGVTAAMTKYSTSTNSGDDGNYIRYQVFKEQPYAGAGQGWPDPKFHFWAYDVAEGKITLI